MKKYTKIIVDLPRGSIESDGDKNGFHIFTLRGMNFKAHCGCDMCNGSGDYKYSNWQIHELKELAKALLTFCKEVENAEIISPIKHIKG